MGQASTGLRNHMLDSGSFKGAMDDGILEIYSGSPPTSADEATTGTLLVSITDNDQGVGAGQGLDWEASAVGGILSKLSGQTWSGTVGVTGLATYYRFVEFADRNGTGGGSSSTAKRYQGTVGVLDEDLVLEDASLAISTLLPIIAFQIALPNTASA